MIPQHVGKVPIKGKQRTQRDARKKAAKECTQEENLTMLILDFVAIHKDIGQVHSWRGTWSLVFVSGLLWLAFGGVFAGKLGELRLLVHFVDEHCKNKRTKEKKAANANNYCKFGTQSAKLKIRCATKHIFNRWKFLGTSSNVCVCCRVAVTRVRTGSPPAKFAELRVLHMLSMSTAKKRWTE